MTRLYEEIIFKFQTKIFLLTQAFDSIQLFTFKFLNYCSASWRVNLTSLQPL